MLATRPAVAHILVVDGEEPILESVCFTLEHDGYQVVPAANAATALDYLSENMPDLVILEMTLPDRSGLDLCRYVRALGETPILMVSARDSVEDRVLGLDSGADDYLVKPFRFRELLARVGALLRRSQKQTQFTPQCGELRLNVQRRAFSLGQQELSLTLREYELLEFLLRRAHQVVTRAELLAQLWGLAGPAETNVLDVYISSVRSKLGRSGRHMIRTVRGVGYALG
ncbi:response regulator transcription factor [bacterium]|nr:response regulator transcription factor [bacterium]